jgi:hypothetical protein
MHFVSRDEQLPVDTSSTPQNNIDYMHIACVYGYSNLSLIFVGVLSHVPVEIFRNVLMIAGGLNSLIFLYGNLWNSNALERRSIVLGITASAQVITYLAFYVIV